MSRGEASALWEEKETPQGYIFVKTPQGWVLKHRYLMEQHLGRELETTERVIFKDRDRTNCVLENLEVKLKQPKDRKALEQRKEQLEKELEEVNSELEEEDAS